MILYTDIMEMTDKYSKETSKPEVLRPSKDENTDEEIRERDKANPLVGNQESPETKRLRSKVEMMKRSIAEGNNTFTKDQLQVAEAELKKAEGK